LISKQQPACSKLKPDYQRQLIARFIEEVGNRNIVLETSVPNPYGIRNRLYNLLELDFKQKTLSGLSSVFVSY